jgi:outer membrane protein assembly factor BamA
MEQPSIPLRIFLAVLLILFLSGITSVTAGNQKPDSAGFVIIRNIILEGNKVTKSSIITRELRFRTNDTIPLGSFPAMLTAGKENVFNTKLFNVVTVDTAFVEDSRVDVRISVIERWYVWPVPFFEISDRNFNVWWETKDFSRLTYGVDLTFYNMRGRNETMKILTHFGYNQLYGINYFIPYVNRKQTIGIGFGADVELNHEMGVATANNEVVYYKDASNFPKQLIFGFAEMRYRPSIYTYHTFRLAYNQYYFMDSVLAVPGFALKNENSQIFGTLYYQFRNDHRDIQYYPLTGFYFDLEFVHCFPYSYTHNTYLKANARKYWQIYNRWYFASGLTLKISLEKEQPYYLARGLGYGREYVRGYEYYVVDGQHFILWKSNFKFAIIPQRMIKLGFLKSSKFNTVPLAMYANVFADMGYVYHYNTETDYRTNPGNTLQNSFMIGYGAGIDFTTYYDIVIRCEFAMNLFNKPGFYLHFTAPI